MSIVLFRQTAASKLHEKLKPPGYLLQINKSFRAEDRNSVSLAAVLLNKFRLGLDLYLFKV